jgi:hypothetical protein
VSDTRIPCDRHEDDDYHVRTTQEPVVYGPLSSATHCAILNACTLRLTEGYGFFASEAIVEMEDIYVATRKFCSHPIPALCPSLDTQMTNLGHLKLLGRHEG